MSEAIQQIVRKKYIPTRGGIMRRDNLGVRSLVMLWTRDWVSERSEVRFLGPIIYRIK